MLAWLDQSACPAEMKTIIVTQSQILPLVGIAVLVGLYLIGVTVTHLRRSRERSREVAAMGGTGTSPAHLGVASFSSEGFAVSEGVSASAARLASLSAPRTDVPHAAGDVHTNAPSEPAVTPSEPAGTPPAPAPAATPMPAPLPGIDDAVFWTRLTDAESARVARYDRSATIVLIELDGLDRLVASLGPAAGDRIIAATAATIRAEARVSDTVARLGHSRFGVLLIETDEVSAINFTERVRAICDRWLQTGAVALRVALGHCSLTSAIGPADAMRLSQERLDRERRSMTFDPEAAGLGQLPHAEAPKG